MTKKFVYLAGPIAGCDRGEANDWRKDIQARFIDGIVGISPLRCEPLIKKRYDDPKEFAEGKGQYKDVRFGTASAINGKNYLDTVSADLVLAYLSREMNERRPSYGTVMEIAWAIAMHKPIILVSDDPYLINHPLISENVSWIVDNFDDALDIIHGLFEDYVYDKKENEIMAEQLWPSIQDEI